MTLIQTNLRKIWNRTKNKRKITQVQAGKELGMTQGQFSQYLNGLVAVTPSTVIKLANFLEVSPLEIDPTIGDHLPNIKKISILCGTEDATKKSAEQLHIPYDTDVVYIRADSLLKTDDVSFPKGTLFVCLKNVKASKYPLCLIRCKGQKSLSLHKTDSIPSKLKVLKNYPILGVYYI